MPRNPSVPSPVLLACLLLGLGNAGCIKAPTQSATMMEAKDLVDITSSQLRQEVHDFAERFATIVEGTADRIIAESDDPAIQRRALIWKMYAIPEVHRAAFHADPLVALIDCAVLCGQMLEAVETGRASRRYGEYQHLAIRAARALNEDVWRLGESLTLSGDPAEVRRQVAEFVAEHPIDDEVYLRDSVQPLLARMTKGGVRGAGAMIGGITETVNDLADRLTIYAGHLPRQARWQAELVLLETIQELNVDGALSQVDSLAASFQRIAETVESTPELIATERATTLQIMEEMVGRSFEEVHEQRVATIADLKAEREVLVRVVEEQTEKALSVLQQERAAALEHLDGLALASIDTTFDRVNELTDRLFFRGLILLAILTVTLVVAAVVVATILRPRRGRSHA